MNGAPSIDDYLKVPPPPIRLSGGRRAAIVTRYDPEQPLVTVITIVKNRKKTLPKTIASVFSQSYPNIEYIVIDGASTDGTIDVIRQFDDRIDLWISEPDLGPTDAFNKGISLAHGDIFFWLSSDDWIEHDFIKTAVRALINSGADFVFGDMAMYSGKDIVSLVSSGEDYAKALVSGNPRFNFPSMLIKKECFHRAGLFDMAYRHTSDYEWLLRFHGQGGRGHYEKSLVVHRRTGGIGESHPFKSALEQLNILRQHRLPVRGALVAHSRHLLRRTAGRLARIFLPGYVYKKLSRAKK